MSIYLLAGLEAKAMGEKETGAVPVAATEKEDAAAGMVAAVGKETVEKEKEALAAAGGYPGRR